MRVLRKSYFTLLELLIVMFLLAFATALTGIKIKQAYDEQRFLSEMQQVVSHLQMAQDLMLVLQADTKVLFTRDRQNNTYTYRISSDNKLNNAILDKDHVLTSIRAIEFEGYTPKEEGAIAIDFFSRGMAMSSGRLIFSDQEGSPREGNSHQIVLLGYPHFLASEKYQKNVRARPSRSNLGEELYPKILLQPDTIDKVPDDKKSK